MVCDFMHTCIATLHGNSAVIKWGWGPSELHKRKIEGFVVLYCWYWYSLPKCFWIVVAKALGTKTELVGGDRPFGPSRDVWPWKLRGRLCSYDDVER